MPGPKFRESRVSQEPKENAIYNVIIGTAGHVDHGKSTLVIALTGIDTDRLPEEKEREMTIDLGFAPFRLKDGQTVGIIDVPGHERFVKNMVAGATSIDIVLLVVAADEGPNLQTREHLTIMSLLGLRRGIIVLTKIDKADGNLRSRVKSDVEGLVRHTFLADAPVCEVSALRGEGMPELINVINETVLATPRREAKGVFRMPIQRVFSARGFGTIITGVPVSGRAKPGDVLEILPLSKTGRIRSVQAYKKEVPELSAGHSSSINISDVEHAAVHRGMVAATPGYFRPSTMVAGRFRYVPTIPRSLANVTPVKLHVGTGETDGRLILLDKKKLEPGDECYIQVRLAEPIVVASGDRFILRLQSPVYTLGGGVVLEAGNTKFRQSRDETTFKLVEREQAMADPLSAAEYVFKDMGPRIVRRNEFALAAGLPESAAQAALAGFEAAGKLVKTEGGGFIHAGTFAESRECLMDLVGQFHARNPQECGIEAAKLRHESHFENDLFSFVLADLERGRVLARDGEKIRLAAFAIQLSKDDTQALEDLEKAVLGCGLAALSLRELHERFIQFRPERIDRAIQILVDRGTIRRFKSAMFLHRTKLDEARQRVGEAIRTRGPMEVVPMKEVLGLSRKYTILLLELLDDLGFTKRVGDTRVLKESPQTKEAQSEKGEP
jgi:selenocysteine-specific elongation factor